MAKKQAGGKIPDEVQPAFDVIFKIVDDFCREHLNEEYAVLCLKLTEKLAMVGLKLLPQVMDLVILLLNMLIIHNLLVQLLLAQQQME